MAIEKLAARLTKGELIILDGGMGTEIKRRGLATGSGDLAVHGMVREPDKLREIHENFIEAGADVILTNTYLCNAGSLSRTGVDSNRVAELNSLACDI
ncbi:MAG: homocysteine S-methyltransferase family protein, partial [Dehalococcoidia bacterium]